MISQNLQYEILIDRLKKNPALWAFSCEKLHCTTDKFSRVALPDIIDVYLRSILHYDGAYLLIDIHRSIIVFERAMKIRYVYDERFRRK